MENKENKMIFCPKLRHALEKKRISAPMLTAAPNGDCATLLQGQGIPCRLHHGGDD